QPCQAELGRRLGGMARRLAATALPAMSISVPVASAATVSSPATIATAHSASRVIEPRSAGIPQPDRDRKAEVGAAVAGVDGEAHEARQEADPLPAVAPRRRVGRQRRAEIG